MFSCSLQTLQIFSFQLNVELFSEDFHAYLVGEDNEKIETAVDKESFYKGYDEGII